MVHLRFVFLTLIENPRWLPLRNQILRRKYRKKITWLVRNYWFFWTEALQKWFI